MLGYVNACICKYLLHRLHRLQTPRERYAAAAIMGNKQSLPFDRERMDEYLALTQFNEAQILEYVLRLSSCVTCTTQH